MGVVVPRAPLVKIFRNHHWAELLLKVEIVRCPESQGEGQASRFSCQMPGRARLLGGEWQCAVHGTRALLQALELPGACMEPREGSHLPHLPPRSDNEDSQGDRHALAASDLWSCAIVIYVTLGMFSRLPSVNGSHGTD